MYIFSFEGDEGNFFGKNLHMQKPHCLDNVPHVKSTVIIVSNCWLL